MVSSQYRTSSPHIMQIKCSSSWAQILPLVLLHCQSNPFLALQLYFFKIHYNIILPSMVRSSKRSPSFSFLRQNPEPISLSLVRNISWPSNKLWWTVQITQHSIYSVLHSPPLWPTLPQTPVLEWSQSMFSSQCDQPTFRLTHKNKQIW